MKNAIGTSAVDRSFRDELVVANLGGLPFSWSLNGEFNFSPELTQQQVSAIKEVYSKHNPLIGALVRYTQTKQEAMVSTSIRVNVNPTGTPIVVTACCDNGCMINMNSAARQATKNPSRTFSWVGFDGKTTKLTADQIHTLFDTVSGIHQSIFDVYSEVAELIKSGSITTAAQIDAKYKAIADWIPADTVAVNS